MENSRKNLFIYFEDELGQVRVTIRDLKLDKNSKFHFKVKILSHHEKVEERIQFWENLISKNF